MSNSKKDAAAQKQGETTKAIKARVANKLRRDFFKMTTGSFSNEQKIEYFNNLLFEVQDMHDALSAHKKKSQNKRAVEQERRENGYYERKAEKKSKASEQIAYLVSKLRARSSVNA